MRSLDAAHLLGCIHTTVICLYLSLVCSWYF